MGQWDYAEDNNPYEKRTTLDFHGLVIKYFDKYGELVVSPANDPSVQLAKERTIRFIRTLLVGYDFQRDDSEFVEVYDSWEEEKKNHKSHSVTNHDFRVAWDTFLDRVFHICVSRATKYNLLGKKHGAVVVDDNKTKLLPNKYPDFEVEVKEEIEEQVEEKQEVENGQSTD
jgi:hypothetical protein